MSVRALRRGSIAASRVTTVTPNTTYTIFGDTSDGYTSGSPGEATGGTPVTSGDIFVGQQVASAYQGYLAFDTSSVADSAIITAVTLSVYGMNDSSTVDFTLEARIHDWGASLTDADWLTASAQATKTLVATFNTASWNAAGYNAFVSDPAFLTNINKTGFTRLVLSSSRHRTGATPSGTEYVGFRGSEQSGTTQDPKLVIEAFV